MSFLQERIKLCAVSDRTSNARLRGQAELGCHLAAVHRTRNYVGSTLGSIFTSYHMISVPRWSVFSSCKQIKARTAGFEANGNPLEDNDLVYKA